MSGHRIVRYADDITSILDDDLKLTVNRDKTHRTHALRGQGQGDYVLIETGALPQEY